MAQWNWLTITGALLATACTPTLSVYGVMAGETYTGTTTGDSQYGDMMLSNGKGKSCIGERRGATNSGGNSGSGHGLLTCNDGTQIVIQYTKIAFASGYGFGTSSNGDTVRFTFGLTPDESAKYIDQGGQQTAAAPGASPPPTRRKASGTGFFITRQGHLLTNAHVVNECKELTVASPRGTASPARVVANDKQNDLAVLQSDDRPTAIATLRGARPVRPGETVVAYGFPLTGALSSGGVLTSGSISALAGFRDDTRYFQISAPIQPGNSGGPLLDTTGAVVGVTSSGLGGSRAGAVPQNVNFALKVGVIRTFLDSAGISAETSPGGLDLSLPDIGEKARAFTAFIECKN